MEEHEMKTRVARTLKWNTVDKLASQVMYAVTGIILANVLSQEDFGLVAAVMVFQAFALPFIDSGFANALLQRKNPTRLDYSTVFWFNMAMAGIIYIILYACAPIIARCFQDNRQLIPLSRVMFLTFVLFATSIVQTNVLVKKMDVKMVAISNTVAMVVSGGIGIGLALGGYGAWAIVWQSISLAAVRSLILWSTSRWHPLFRFSWTVLKSFFKVGFGTMGSAWLNVLFQNIYSFFIGNRNGLVSLGYYSQADRWSKMGISSLSQILNVSFLPALSQYQDDPSKFASATAKMNRFTAYLLFPCVGFLIVMTTPIFHILFKDKWDPSIILFQLLLVRGIFVVLTSVYSNYLLARGNAKLMIATEAVRDITALIAIAITLPCIGWETPANITYGVQIFLLGQIVASVVSWVYTLWYAAKHSWRKKGEYISDLVPYAALTLLIMLPVGLLPRFISNDWLLLVAQGALALGLYLGINAALGSKVQQDVLAHLFKKGR